MLLEAVTAIILTSSPVLKDAIQEIAGPTVQVTNVVESMRDPHHFDPSIQTLKSFKTAKLAVFVGPNFETWAPNLITRTKFEAPTIYLAEKLDLKNQDPHFWLDPEQMIKAIAILEKEIAKLNPASAKEIEERSKKYQEKIQTLAKTQKQKFQALPETKRSVVVESNSFDHYCRYYGLDCLTISTKKHRTEVSGKELNQTQAKIKERPRSAYLYEPHQALGASKQRAKDLGLSALGPFYIESLGDSKQGPQTYLELLEANAQLLLRQP